MSDSQAFNQLRYLLLRRGLPPAYVDRAIEELSEHRENGEREAITAGLDPKLAEKSSLEKLGNIDNLADIICKRMRHRTFLGRHPIFFFLILPLALLFLSGVLAMSSVQIICEMTHTISGGKIHYEGPPANLYPYINAFFHVLNFGLLPMLGLGLCLTARKFFCGFKWAFWASLTLAVIGYFFFYYVHIPPPGSDPTKFGIGYGFQYGLSSEIFHRRDCTIRFISSLVRFLLPLSTFALFYFLNSPKRLLKGAAVLLCILAFLGVQVSPSCGAENTDRRKSAREIEKLFPRQNFPDIVVNRGKAEILERIEAIAEDRTGTTVTVSIILDNDDETVPVDGIVVTEWIPDTVSRLYRGYDDKAGSGGWFELFLAKRQDRPKIVAEYGYRRRDGTIVFRPLTQDVPPSKISAIRWKLTGKPDAPVLGKDNTKPECRDYDRYGFADDPANQWCLMDTGNPDAVTLQYKIRTKRLKEASKIHVWRGWISQRSVPFIEAVLRVKKNMYRMDSKGIVKVFSADGSGSAGSKAVRGKPKGTVVYEIVFENDGMDRADSLVLIDMLDPGAVFDPRVNDTYANLFKDWSFYSLPKRKVPIRFSYATKVGSDTFFPLTDTTPAELVRAIKISFENGLATPPDNGNDNRYKLDFEREPAYGEKADTDQGYVRFAVRF